MSIGGSLQISEKVETTTRSVFFPAFTNCEQQYSIFALSSLCFSCSDITRAVAGATNPRLSMTASAKWLLNCAEFTNFFTMSLINDTVTADRRLVISLCRAMTVSSTSSLIVYWHGAECHRFRHARRPHYSSQARRAMFKIFALLFGDEVFSINAEYFFKF